MDFKLENDKYQCLISFDEIRGHLPREAMLAGMDLPAIHTHYQFWVNNETGELMGRHPHPDLNPENKIVWVYSPQNRRWIANSVS